MAHCVSDIVTFSCDFGVVFFVSRSPVENINKTIIRVKKTYYMESHVVSNLISLSVIIRFLFLQQNVTSNLIYYIIISTVIIRSAVIFMVEILSHETTDQINFTVVQDRNCQILSE